MDNKLGPFQTILLDLLYSRLTKVSTVSFLVSISYAYVLLGVQSYTFLGIWCFILLILNSARCLYAYSYSKNPEQYSFKGWIKRYYLLGISVGGCWGLMVLLIINKLPMSSEMITLAYIVGMVAGGAVGNIVDKKTALVYATIVFVPYCIKTIVEARDFYEIFLVGMFLFMYVVYQMIINFNEVILKSIRLGIEKEELLDQLQGKLELEKELQRQKIKGLQSAKLISLGEMAAGVAHEINNPLTIALGKLDLLIKKITKGDCSHDHTLEQISSIKDANRRVADIVSSMKNLSRIKDDVEFQVFSVRELIDIVSPLYSQRLKFFNVDIKHDLLCKNIYADRGEISQVLLNLVNNSIDAVKDSDREKWIRVETQEGNGFILIKVSDSGEGINEAIKDKIFEPFFTSKKVGEGTGLGLSLSKNMMERNGGDLYLDPRQDNTTFVIKLKIAE